MQIIELTRDNENAAEVRDATVEAMRRGDLVLFPTDTVYGLGGLAFSKRVMDKLRSVKPERSAKPTSVLMDNIIRMSQCAGDVPGPRLVALAEAFWPGPLTLVWKTSNVIPAEFQSPDRSLGYRIPKHAWLLEVLQDLEAPVWATSANLPGQPAPRIFTEVREAVLNACDLVVKTSQLLSGQASSVVDVRGREPVVMREGAIREDDLRRAWRNG